MATETNTIDVNETLVENYKVAAGATILRSKTLQVDTGSGAVAVDLTGVTWEVKVTKPRGGTAYVNVTTAADESVSGVIVDTAASGQFSYRIFTAGLSNGLYYWALRATFPSGTTTLKYQVKDLIGGTLEIATDPT